LTDVLVLKRPARQLRIRATLQDPKDRQPTRIRFLGVSVVNSSIPARGAGTAGPARGIVLSVPERSQLDYRNGEAWCSPTSLSMILGFWARQSNRPELDRSVPEIAAGVNDPCWPGTGNWSFNTAYAGSFRGLRAFVTRLSCVTELEPWVASGVPVAASVSNSVLKGEAQRNDGHIVVVIGFDARGDVVLNDPGTRKAVRKIVPRERFAAAWAHSRNTVYLVFPENHAIPTATDGHW
jgi:hypothetical protein